MKITVMLPGQKGGTSCESYSFTTVFNKGLASSIKGMRGKAVESDLALGIFKQIKWESDIKSLLTKRVVLIPVSLALIGSAYLTPIAGVAFVTARVFMAILGATILYAASNRKINKISKAYSQESSKASVFIKAFQGAKSPDAAKKLAQQLKAGQVTFTLS